MKVPYEPKTDLHSVFLVNLRTRRQELRLTQEEVAERLGISQSAYCNLEAGKRCPNLKTIEKAAQALNLPAASLLIANTSVAAA